MDLSNIFDDSLRDYLIKVFQNLYTHLLMVLVCDSEENLFHFSLR